MIVERKFTILVQDFIHKTVAATGSLMSTNDMLYDFTIEAFHLLLDFESSGLPIAE